VNNTAKIYVDSADVQKLLKGMPENIRRNVQRRAGNEIMPRWARRLGNEWLTTTYKRNGSKQKHRRAIWAAAKSRVRPRGQGETARMVMNVHIKYGKKGGTLASGNQRIYHLLEYGHRNKAAWSFTEGKHVSRDWARLNLRKMLEEISKEVLVQAQKSFTDKRRPRANRKRA
jgi:hypothetical protein